MERFSRTAGLIGEGGVEKLKNKTVALFGLGGVGGYTLEALARCGVGRLVLFDFDTVSESNINRQILATVDTVGQKKIDVATRRVRAVNPDCTVEVHDLFLLPENADDIDFSAFDYVADAIDTVSGKIALAKRCQAVGTPLISCMGTGNKLDPTRFHVDDISKTHTDPLARAMRGLLKKNGVRRLKVVWSDEEPLPSGIPCDEKTGKPVPSSIAFVPSVAGLIMASAIVRDLLKDDEKV